MPWEELYAKYDLPIGLHIEDGEDITYARRKTEKEDIYFIYNPDEDRESLRCTFAVNGKVPEFWDPTTGSIYSLEDYEVIDGKTQVTVPIPPKNSGFVVFRSSASLSKEPHPSSLSNESVQNVEGPWQVEFPKLKKGPLTVTFDRLADWTSHEAEGIKHYSGTAIYHTRFNLSEKQVLEGRRLTLDLGEVQVAARVTLNGQALGVLWHAPYKIDITSAAKSGKNELQLEVVNQWANRLIGDEAFPNLTGYDLRPLIEKPLVIRDPQLSLVNEYKMVDWYTANEPAPLGQRSTFTTYPFFKKNSKLLPAGLIGPVKVQISKHSEK